MRTGRCQCGEIRYESVGETLSLYVCHCRECQKQSASAFGITLEVSRAGFHVSFQALLFLMALKNFRKKIEAALFGN